MKVIVTGGLGFIGRNLARYIRRQTNAVELHSVDWFAAAPDADHALFDTSTIACFASDAARDVFRDADAVIHLAATTTVQDSIADPAASFHNNVIKTQVLLDHLRHVAPNAHFIFASTGGAIIGDHDGPIGEQLAPRPRSPYGATKLAVEGLLSAYDGSYGMRAASLRFSNVYGPNSERKGSVVATFCRRWLQGGSLHVNGDGAQTRDYVFVDDICRAIWLTLQKQASGVYQLGTGVETSIIDLIAVLKSLEPDRKASITHGPELPGEVRSNVCDITRARADLGFTPEYDLRRGVGETLDWFKAQAA